jgi:hypothetical protein
MLSKHILALATPMRNVSVSRTGTILLMLHLAVPALHAQASAAQVQRGSKVAGTVTDTLGRPVASAQVAVMLSQGTAQSDSTGRFRLEGIRPGLAQLQVQHLGYMPGTFTILVPPDTTLSVTVQLTPTSADFATLAGDWIVRFETGHYSSGNDMHIADSAGTYGGYLRIATYGGGSYTLRAVQTENDQVVLIFRTRSGEEQRLEIDTRGANQLQGLYAMRSRAGGSEITGRFSAQRR